MKWVTNRGKNNRAKILLRTDPSICIFRMNVLKMSVIHKHINIRVSKFKDINRSGTSSSTSSVPLCTY